MARPSIIVQADRVIPRREVILLVLLVILVWTLQLRYPPLSYPHIGILQLLVLAMVAVMLPVRLLRSMYGAPAPRLHPAFLPGLLFVVWALARWLIDGLPFSGAGDIGTIMWTATYGIVGYTLTRSASSVNHDAPSVSISRILLTAISAVGLACGIHAVWQYFFSYADAYRLLSNEIGNRPPDLTEMGLLHHLKLRRVASIFGDPNSLATFSALALAASLELVSRAGSAGRTPLRVLGLAAIPACFTAVYLSGSRGGVIDVLLVLLIYSLLLLNQRRKRRTSHGAIKAVGVLIATLVFFLSHNVPSAQTDEGVAELSSHESDNSGWTWRSSTITERLHYMQIGASMIKMAPMMGLGPGSVERYFGRLKPPEARESKYLHNWVFQIWAELGFVGIALAGWFIVTMIVAIHRTHLWDTPADRASVVIFGLLLMDGLIQVTWNQRELMCTFGLITGVIMGRSVVHEASLNERFPKSARLAIVVIYMTLFATMEARYLAGRSAKFKALDAMAAGDPSSATQYWDKVTVYTPGDPQSYAARASMLAASQQWSQAKRLLDKALTLNPDSAALNAEYAKLADQLKQTTEAEEHLTRSLQLYPSHPEYNYLMARHQLGRGHRQAALKHARMAAKYNYITGVQPTYDALVHELESLTQP